MSIQRLRTDASRTLLTTPHDDPEGDPGHPGPLLDEHGHLDIQTDPEDLFLQLWMGRTAADQLQQGLDEVATACGAPLQFPCHVVAPGPRGQLRTFGIQPSMPPGTLAPPGIHPINYSVRTYGYRLSDTLWVCVVPPGQPDGELVVLGQILAAGRTSKLEPILDNLRDRIGGPALQRALAHGRRAGALLSDSSGVVIRDGLIAPVVQQATDRVGYALRRLVKLRQQAQSEVLKRYTALQHRLLKRHSGRLSAARGYGLDDAQALIQRLIVVLAERYASEQRPVVTFTRAIYDAVRRDLPREIDRTSGDSIRLGGLKAWLHTHPGVHDVASARQAGLTSAYSDHQIQVALASLATTHISLQDDDRDPDGVSVHQSLYSADWGDYQLADQGDLLKQMSVWAQACNVPIADMRCYLYHVGALDGSPHSASACQAVFGKQAANNLDKTEFRLFAPFVRPGEQWLRDRDQIKLRAMAALTAEGGLVTAHLIKERIERAQLGDG